MPHCKRCIAVRLKLFQKPKVLALVVVGKLQYDVVLGYMVVGRVRAHSDASQLLTLVLRVFPCLRQHTIVPVNVVRVETQLVLFDVLLQWV